MESRTEPDPILIIQGEFGGRVSAVKVSVDHALFECGSSVLEGLDRLFKIIWIINLSYTSKATNFFYFLQTLYEMKYGKVPSTVSQLQNMLSKLL